MDALLRNATSLGLLEEDARVALEEGAGQLRRVSAQEEVAEVAAAVESKLEDVWRVLQASALHRPAVMTVQCVHVLCTHV